MNNSPKIDWFVLFVWITLAVFVIAFWAIAIRLGVALVFLGLAIAFVIGIMASGNLEKGDKNE